MFTWRVTDSTADKLRLHRRPQHQEHVDDDHSNSNDHTNAGVDAENASPNATPTRLLKRKLTSTIPAAAARAGLDPDGLAATVASYNALGPDASDPAGKPAAARRPQDQPPYYLIDVSVRPRLFYPAPVLTLGGLVVAPGSGQVLRPDGRPVDGLYAAGRTAACLCSRSYVSGLSLADCVFSGRRAGHHAATETITLRRT